MYINKIKKIFSYSPFILFFVGNFIFCSEKAKTIFEQDGLRSKIIDFQTEKAKLVDKKSKEQDERISKLREILSQLKSPSTKKNIAISTPLRSFFAAHNLYPKADLIQKAYANSAESLFINTIKKENQFLDKFATFKIVDFDKKRDRQFIEKALTGEDAKLLGNGIPLTKEQIDFMLNNLKPPNFRAPIYHLIIKVLLENDKPVGFITYFDYYWPKAAIELLYVDPNFRKKGYGKELMKYAIDDLLNNFGGFKIIIVETNIENTPTQKLFQSLGFKESGRKHTTIKFYLIADKEDPFNDILISSL